MTRKECRLHRPKSRRLEKGEAAVGWGEGRIVSQVQEGPSLRQEVISGLAFGYLGCFLIVRGCSMLGNGVSLGDLGATKPL